MNLVIDQMIVLCCVVAKELLSVHTSYMQCEETNPEAVKRHEHSCDNVRRNSQSSLWKTNGDIDPPSQAASISIQILTTNHYHANLNCKNIVVNHMQALIYVLLSLLYSIVNYHDVPTIHLK